MRSFYSICLMLLTGISAVPALEIHQNDIHLKSRNIKIAASFDEVTRKFESEFGHMDIQKLEQLLQSGAGKDEVKQALETMVAGYDLVIFSRLPMGDIFQLLGTRTSRLNKYTIGNPFTASQLVERNVVAGLYVPFVVIIYGDDNQTSIDYLLPSSLIDQISADASSTGRKLDEIMDSIVRKSGSD